MSWWVIDEFVGTALENAVDEVAHRWLDEHSPFRNVRYGVWFGRMNREGTRMRTAYTLRGAMIGAAAALLAAPSLLTASGALAAEATGVEAAAIESEASSPAAEAPSPEMPEALAASAEPPAATAEGAVVPAAPAAEAPVEAGAPATAVEAPASAEVPIRGDEESTAGATQAHPVGEETPDTTAPTAWLVETETEHGWHRSIDDFEYHARDDESGLKFIYVGVDGWLYEHNGSNWSFGVLPDNLRDGKHPVTFWAVDNAGNSGTPQRAIASIDRTAPEVHVESPTGAAEFTVGEDVTFEYGCADATSGILTCEADIANGSPLPTDAVGEHAVAIEAIDLAGNISTHVYEYQVMADRSPVVVLGAPALPASGWYTEEVPLTLTATPTDGATIRTIEWALEGASNGEGESAAGATTTELLVHDEGETTVTYWATDSLGRVSQPQTFTLKIDRTGPEITWSVEEARISELTIEQGDQVLLEIECTDHLSGVDKCHNNAADDYLPSDEVGVYTVGFLATDLAGNETRSELEYEVVPAEEPGNGSGGSGNSEGNGSGGSGNSGGSGSDGGSASDGGNGGGSVGHQNPAAGSLAQTGVEVAIPVLTGMLLLTLGAMAVLRRRTAAR